MSSKGTILSQKEAELLDNLIAEKGLFVSFDQIAEEVGSLESRQEIRNLVSKLVKNGWLVRIKKGLYYITTLESRGFFNISEFVVAQFIVKDSYISFYSALQYHGMFDQHLSAVTSVSLKKASKREIQGINFEFLTTGKDNFYGWEEFNIEGFSVKIATAEKALLDILNFKRTVHSADVVLEKIKEHQGDLDLDRLNEFSRDQTVTVKRILGLLLDLAGVDSGSLYDMVKNKSGSSYMTGDSKNFNSKWRLYYHDHFD